MIAGRARCSGCSPRKILRAGGRIDGDPRHRRAGETLRRAGPLPALRAVALFRQGPGPAARGARAGATCSASTRSRRSATAGCARSALPAGGGTGTSVAGGLLLLHQGVVPNVNLAMARRLRASLGRACSSAGARCSTPRAAPRSRASPWRVTARASAAADGGGGTRPDRRARRGACTGAACRGGPRPAEQARRAGAAREEWAAAVSRRALPPGSRSSACLAATRSSAAAKR